MKGRHGRKWLEEAAGALRIAAISWIAFGGIYTILIAGFGRIAAPSSSRGSLIRNSDGVIIGSALIAQKFTEPWYFWPRPSAVDYDASAAGGSNLPPSSPELARDVRRRIAAMGGSPENPVPVELLAASGSGLDPLLPPAAIEYQAGRVASARGLDPELFRKWLGARVAPGRDGRRKAPLVNVLQLNIALDERFGPPLAADRTGREEVR
jgi:potassium-transporting ATPase KdpC subunit